MRSLSDISFSISKRGHSRNVDDVNNFRNLNTDWPFFGINSIINLNTCMMSLNPALEEVSCNICNLLSKLH